MQYNYTQEELIDLADQAINELVYEKEDLQKAYNYYHGKRDEDQFRYLEENFGIGNPTAVQFTPLIKKHIDALVGEYLGSPIIPKITCKDKDTIYNMTREKELKISANIYKELQTRLHNKLLKYFQTQKDEELQDPVIAEQLQAIVDDLDSNFTSKFEIAAQNIIQYVIQARQTDLPTKLRQLFLDLLVTGYTFYKVGQTPDGKNINIEVLNPLDVFVDKNFNSPYVKDSYRAVVRRWLTKSEIFNRYGDKLSTEDKKAINDRLGEGKNSDSVKYVRATRSIGQNDGILADSSVKLSHNTHQKDYYNSQLIPVYEVEWTAVDKNFIMQRYEVIRISTGIYVVNGKDDNVQRSVSNPTYCGLSVNGVYFDNRTDEPFSLVKSCMHLQDRYDLLIFYRDNIIANSGTVGDWIDQSLIPANLGGSPAERLQKFIAYKKQGIGLIDTTQEGRLATGQAPINTIFNGFDDTVKSPAIQAIQYAIDSIEQTMCSITGVFRERLNGIEQRDAVSNVKISQTNSFVVTKHWFQQMDITLEELLTDVLNKAKRVFKDGLTGTLILGEKYQKIFTAAPENFTVSDFDVHVLANSDITKDTEQLKQLVPEFVRMQAITPDVVLDVLDTKSLSEAKYKVRTAMKKQKDENNQLQQLMQQLQEAQQQTEQSQKQIKELQQNNEQLQNQIQSLSKEKLEIDREKVAQDAKIRWFEAQTDREYYQSKSKNNDKRTEIEEAQLYDRNPYNDKTRQL